RVVVVAVERHRLLGPQPADEPHRLTQAGEALLVVRPLNAERALVEMLAGADPEDHAPGMERTQRAESLRDDRGVIAKRRRHPRRAQGDSAGALAGSGQPCERQWRVAVGVAPGLEPVAGEPR